MHPFPSIASAYKGVIAPFPTQQWNEKACEGQGEQRFSAWKRFPTCKGTSVVEWWKCVTTILSIPRSPLYGAYYSYEGSVGNHRAALRGAMVRLAGAWRHADGSVPPSRTHAPAPGHVCA